MQSLTIPCESATLLIGDDSEFEFMEPKRLVITPLELCLLSSEEDLFDDE